MPADHLGAFTSAAGMSWQAARHSAPGMARYVTALEIAYAAYELVFAILFLVILVILVILAIPFPQRMRWA
jgi:hypothetical protein